MANDESRRGRRFPWALFGVLPKAQPRHATDAPAQAESGGKRGSAKDLVISKVDAILATTDPCATIYGHRIKLLGREGNVLEISSSVALHELGTMKKNEHFVGGGGTGAFVYSLDLEHADFAELTPSGQVRASIACMLMEVSPAQYCAFCINGVWVMARLASRDGALLTIHAIDRDHAVLSGLALSSSQGLRGENTYVLDLNDPRLLDLRGWKPVVPDGPYLSALEDRR